MFRMITYWWPRMKFSRHVVSRAIVLFCLKKKKKKKNLFFFFFLKFISEIYLKKKKKKKKGSHGLIGSMRIQKAWC